MDSLTEMQRLYLINHYEILHMLDPAGVYERYLQILKSGFKSHYKELCADILDEVPLEVTDLCMHTLNMYKALNCFAMKHDESLLTLCKFEGFSCDTEFQHWDYTNFLLEDPFEYKVLRNTHWDCHTNRAENVAVYVKQIKVWNDLGRPDDVALTLENFNKIIHV